MKPNLFTAILLNPQQIDLTQRKPIEYTVILSGIRSTTDVPITNIGGTESEYWICNQMGGKAFKILSVQSVIGIHDQLDCTIQDVGLFNYHTDSYSYNIPITGKCYVVEVKGTIPAIYTAPDIGQDFDPKWTSELLSRILHENTYDLLSYTGPTGPVGELLKGYDGEIGVTGAIGYMGEKGYTGNTGSLGHIWEGEIGRTGDIGPNNTIPSDSGPHGETGPDGLKGPNGHTGGITGPTGDRGETGPDGPNGNSGFIGIKGHTGDRGETGPDGLIGLIGPTGIIGLTGSRGETGPFVFYSSGNYINLTDNGVSNNIMRYIIGLDIYKSSSPLTINNYDLGSSSPLTRSFRSMYINNIYANNIIKTGGSPIITDIITTNTLNIINELSTDSIQSSSTGITFDYDLYIGTPSNNGNTLLVNNAILTNENNFTSYITTNSEGGNTGADLVFGFTGGSPGTVYIPNGANLFSRANIVAGTLNTKVLNLPLSSPARNYALRNYEVLLPAYNGAPTDMNCSNINIRNADNIYVNTINLVNNYGLPTGTNSTLIDLNGIDGITGPSFINTTNIMARAYMTKGMTSIFSSTITALTTTNMNTLYNTYSNALSTAFITYPKLVSDSRFDNVNSSSAFNPIRQYLSVVNYKLNVHFRFYINKYDPGIQVYSALIPLSTNGMPQQLHGFTYNIFTPYRPCVNPVPISVGRFVVNGSFSTMLCNSFNINASGPDARGGFRPLYPYSGITSYSFDDTVFNISRNTNYWLFPLGLRIYISGSTSGSVLLNDGVGTTGSSALTSYLYHKIEPVTMLLT